jgi:hypothetical protein
MDALAQHRAEADRLIGERIAQLRSLTFEQAQALPEGSSEDTVLGGIPCSVTVFAQHAPWKLTNAVLVTVQVARRKLLGMVEYHIERGLVFSPREGVREATALELQNTGG